jgi:hypothetical protein
MTALRAATLIAAGATIMEGPSVTDTPSMSPSLLPENLDVVLQKLKLLEFGLFGLQQYGRNASLDVEDIGPFYRLAEEIQADVLALRERLVPRSKQ